MRRGHTTPVQVEEPTIETLPSWVPEAIRYGQDSQSGAAVEQLTSDAVISTNIYCEQRFASADGSRIAISRHPFGRPSEIWVCDLRTLRVCRIGEGLALGATSPLNAVYYVASRDGARSLMRLDLMALTTRELFRFDEENWPSRGAVSPDEKWFVGGPFKVMENVYSLVRVDLATGTKQTLCEIQDMFNPHLQFEPSEGRQIVVQVNRGGQKVQPDGRIARTGPRGATLCMVDVETGDVQPLPVGRPDTPPISGHECWAGASKRVIFTAGQYDVTASSYVTLKEPPEAERHMPSAAIYSVALGDTASRVVATGLLYNHLAASDDGRFFIADDHTTGRIYIGSIATGRALPLCDSHTRQGACQHSHAHAYMTPDNRNVIFNSIVTGVAQVYAANVPAGFLDAVLSA